MFVCHPFTTQNVNHANDAVHWCAYFIAHIGEKSAFCKVGGFGGFLRLGEFVRTRFNHIFEIALVIPECFFGFASANDHSVGAIREIAKFLNAE